jgi:hypothetical protein
MQRRRRLMGPVRDPEQDGRQNQTDCSSDQHLDGEDPVPLGGGRKQHAPIETQGRLGARNEMQKAGSDIAEGCHFLLTPRTGEHVRGHLRASRRGKYAERELRRGFLGFLAGQLGHMSPGVTPRWRVHSEPTVNKPRQIAAGF